MTALRFNKKEDLLAALEARRPWAVALDKANKRAHDKAERDYAQKFRARCREMAKWDYEQIKAKFSYRYGGSVMDEATPSCPRSWVQRLDHQIKCVTAGMQQRYVINDSGCYSDIHQLLTHDEHERKDMCA